MRFSFSFWIKRSCVIKYLFLCKYILIYIDGVDIIVQNNVENCTNTDNFISKPCKYVVQGGI